MRNKKIIDSVQFGKPHLPDSLFFISYSLFHLLDAFSQQHIEAFHLRMIL
jgi:hypothetical protein